MLRRYPGRVRVLLLPRHVVLSDGTLPRSIVERPFGPIRTTTVTYSRHTARPTCSSHLLRPLLSFAHSRLPFPRSTPTHEQPFFFSQFSTNGCAPIHLDVG